MSSGKISVSVVIPAYNAAPFLSNAIASLQAQTAEDWEAIIIDDASTDDTLSIARSLEAADPRVRVLSRAENGGPAAARNMGFAGAQGEWIALLDADDVYLPDRLAVMVAEARRLDADLLADNQWLRDPSLGRIVRSGLPRSAPVRRIDLATFYLESLSASGFDLGTLKPLFRTASLRRVSAQYQPFRYGEDFAFVADLLAQGARFWLIPQPYYIYTLTVSELDGQRAATSRTDSNYDLLLLGSNAVLERHGERLTPRERAAVKKRAFFIVEYKSALVFKDQLRKQEYAAMLSTLVRHPIIIVMIFRGLRWRLRVTLPDQRFMPS